MDLSVYLSRFFGIYLVVVSLFYFVRKDYILEVVEDYLKNPASLFTAAIFTFILGLFLVLAHNVWEGNWRGIVTFLSYLTLIKGMTGLYFPSYSKSLKDKVLKSNFYYVLISFWMLIGLYLLYEGFTTGSA